MATILRSIHTRSPLSGILPVAPNLVAFLIFSCAVKPPIKCQARCSASGTVITAAMVYAMMVAISTSVNPDWFHSLNQRSALSVKYNRVTRSRVLFNALRDKNPNNSSSTIASFRDQRTSVQFNRLGLNGTKAFLFIGLSLSLSLGLAPNGALGPLRPGWITTSSNVPSFFSF